MPLPNWSLSTGFHISSRSHFVEIDLLRADSRLPINGISADSDYYILVSEAEQRPRAQLYQFTLRESLPIFLMPLKHVEEAVSVAFQTIFEGVVERASYDLRIDYSQPVPAPPLLAEDQQWLLEILKESSNGSTSNEFT